MLHPILIFLLIFRKKRHLALALFYCPGKDASYVPLFLIPDNN